MSIIRAKNAPSFNLPDIDVIGLAAPSRGARETSAWRLKLSAGAAGVPHSLDREEIFLALTGCAQATVAGERFEIEAGDVLIVPAGQLFSLANPSREPFEAIAVAPAGIRAQLPGAEAFAPPWTL